MKIEKTNVFGFEGAFRGMRNSHNSWNSSDSTVIHSERGDEFFTKEYYMIGKKDLTLARNLIKAGTSDSKFLRMIHVQADVTMPRYWWHEEATYKFIENNSCSTMYKLLDKNHVIDYNDFEYIDKVYLDSVIFNLNAIRTAYLDPDCSNKVKKIYLRQAKMILPESYLQKRTIDTNYAELRNVYNQRKNHKLKEEWQDTFCNWIKTLPYAEELITDGE